MLRSNKLKRSACCRMMIALTLVALFILVGTSNSIPQTNASSASSSLDFYQFLRTLYAQSGCSTKSYSTFSLQSCVVHASSNATVTESLVKSSTSTNQILHVFVLSQLSNGSLLATSNSKSLVVNPGEYTMPATSQATATVQYSYGVNLDGSGSGQSTNNCGELWSSSTDITQGQGTLSWKGPLLADWGPVYPFCYTYGLTDVTYSVQDTYLFSFSGNALQTPQTSVYFYDSDWGMGVEITTTSTVNWYYSL